ncbi:MAG: glycosyltransferase [Isosphaeraceae bacterium]
MVFVHLAASACVGGPESQILGLVGAWPGRSVVLSFAEGGRCQALLDAAAARGAEVVALQSNAPHYRQAVREVAGHLKRLDASVVCCHGYKPDILGLFAALRVGIPALSVAHGWTAATWKVRVNETLDRLCMRGMDRVVCVSEAQAKKVRSAGISARRAVVISNAIDPEPFLDSDPTARAELNALFPAVPPRLIVGSVGRLSPEKGFGVLVEAAAEVARERPDVGFVHLGDGPLRPVLQERVNTLGLAERFRFAGFRADVARLFPHFDLFTLPSYTEGLPCVVLEAFAAGVAVVATAVGGTPEIVVDRVGDPDENGCLVPPGDAAALARSLVALLDDPEARRRLAANGRRRVLELFTFHRQAEAYRAMLADVSAERERGRSDSGPMPAHASSLRG